MISVPDPRETALLSDPRMGKSLGTPAGEPHGVGTKGGTCRPQKKFLISGVTSFTHSFTCRLGCSKVAADTAPDLR